MPKVDLANEIQISVKALASSGEEASKPIKKLLKKNGMYRQGEVVMIIKLECGSTRYENVYISFYMCICMYICI